MPTSRAFLSTNSRANGKIYAIGGTLDDQVNFATVEEYDPVTDNGKTDH